jgi:hypothetical protein
MTERMCRDQKAVASVALAGFVLVSPLLDSLPLDVDDDLRLSSGIVTDDMISDSRRPGERKQYTDVAG